MNLLKKMLMGGLAAMLLLGGMFQASAQEKEIRRIYVWDVTWSMQGQGSYIDEEGFKVKTEDIWNEVKNAIIEDIKGIYDKTTEIVIIPFQHRLIHEDMEEAFADEQGKKQLIDSVKQYKLPKLWVGTAADGDEVKNRKDGKTTQTKLYEPLRDVVEKHLSDDKRNIIEFLSDGRSDWDKDQDKFDKYVTGDSLCEVLNNKDAYLFYYALTKSAENEVIKKYAAADACTGRIIYIDPRVTTGEKVIVYSLLLDLPEVQDLNLAYYDISQSSPIEIRLKNNFLPEAFKELDYKLHVKSSDNDYFKIDQDVMISDNRTMSLDPKWLVNKDDAITMIAGDTLAVNLVFSPAKGMNKYPYNMTSLPKGDNTVTIKLFNTAQNKMDISVGNVAGKSVYFDVWNLWPFSYYKPEEVKVSGTLEVSVTEDHSDLKGPVTLVLCDRYGDAVSADLVEMVVDGVKSADNKLAITPGPGQQSETMTYDIEFALTKKLLDKDDEDCTFGYHFEVEDAPNTLHVINNQKASEELALDEMASIDVDYTINKLKAWFLTGFFFVLACIVAWIAMVQVTARRFNVKHLIAIFISEDSTRKAIMGYNGNLKGSTEILLTNNPNLKQGFFGMLFKGKKSYVYVSGLPVEIVLKVGVKGRVNHIVKTPGGNVRSDFDPNAKKMVLTCKSAAGKQYKIEYPKQF